MNNLTSDNMSDWPIALVLCLIYRSVASKYTITTERLSLSNLFQKECQFNLKISVLSAYSQSSSIDKYERLDLLSYFPHADIQVQTLVYDKVNNCHYCLYAYSI